MTENQPKGGIHSVGKEASTKSLESPVQKEATLSKVYRRNSSALGKYQDFFVGSDRWSALLKFELAAVFMQSMPGALGYFLRKKFYPYLCASVGQDVNWGRNITLRHPGRIYIGDRVAIDDDCLIDAGGSGERGVRVGSDVLIARSTHLQGKTGWLELGDHCVIASHCQMISASGLSIGKWGMISAHCYIGGGRYRIKDRQTPVMKQEVYSKGPIVMEEDVWLGVGVIVQDGVRIGRGSVIGAGAVIREDIPEYAVVTPHTRQLILPRG